MSNWKPKPGTGAITQWHSGKRHPQAPDYKGSYTCDRDYKAGDEIKMGGWIITDPDKTKITLKLDTFVPDPSKAREKPSYPREVQGKDEIPF